MSPGPSHCHYGWLASALGLGLSRLNSHADSSVDERQQSAMDNQYDIDGGGLPKTRLSELLIRETWVRIPPGPPQFCISNGATGPDSNAAYLTIFANGSPSGIAQ